MQHVLVSSQQSSVQKLGASQMTLSPKFRLATLLQSSSSTDDPLQKQHPGSPEVMPGAEPIIPGLPDDVALNCLLRVPVSIHPVCRSVCRRWHALLKSKAQFFHSRKLMGLSSAWLFVFAFHRNTGKIQWQVLDLVHCSWHTIPSMPCRNGACAHGFSCIAIPPEGNLLVYGGLISDADCPLHLVLKYEMHTNRWTVMNTMLTPRSSCASGMIDGTVYVAGGYSTEQFELNSAEALDPLNGNWRPIASMGANMAFFDSAVLDGKFLMTEGWMWPFFFSPRGQVYDPKTDSWEAMSAGLREGWTGLSAVVHQHLFVVSEHEKMGLKVYDPQTDSWDPVEGPSMPKRIMKPLSVTSNGCRIFVVGRGLCVAVGHIKNIAFDMEHTKKNRFSVQWQDIEEPPELSSFFPSRCQVLFA